MRMSFYLWPSSHKLITPVSEKSDKYHLGVILQNIWWVFMITECNVVSKMGWWKRKGALAKKKKKNLNKVFVFVLSRSHVWVFVTSRTVARQASLSFTNSQSLLKFMSIESVMQSNHLILCHPLLLLPSIFPSIRVFSSELVLCIRWPKYWIFCFSICPSNECSGFIFFIVDWFVLLAVQGTLKSLFQFCSSKSSVLRCSALYMVQSSHQYLTTGKIIALTIWSFEGKVMSLLFNMLSRFVIAFISSSKCLLSHSSVTISSAIGTQENKVTACPFPLPNCHEVIGPHVMILVSLTLSFKPAFSLSFFHSYQVPLVLLHFLPWKWYYLHIWGC